MPIKTQGDLPVKEILERENIFVMDEKRAMHQDIRPIQILILNLMPLKEETELQLLRSLSNSPLQVDVTFMAVESHEAKNTSLSHLNKFYETFTDVKKRKFDGMIITGAPVEQMPFEEVDYWNELTEIMDWTEEHVTSTIFLCWAAQASLYYFYGDVYKRQSIYRLCICTSAKQIRSVAVSGVSCSGEFSLRISSGDCGTYDISGSIYFYGLCGLISVCKKMVP